MIHCHFMCHGSCRMIPLFFPENRVPPNLKTWYSPNLWLFNIFPMKIHGQYLDTTNPPFSVRPIYHIKLITL